VRAVYVQCLEKTGQVEESRRQAALLEVEAPGWRSGPNPALLEKLERPKDSYHGASFRQLRMLMQIQAELKHSKLPVPEHVALHYQQGVEYLQRGADREAIEELHQVIDYNPEETEAYRDLARIYRKAQRWDEAVKALSQPLQRDPIAEDYLLLAEILMAQGKLEDARSQLDAALRLEPENRAAAALREELSSRSAAPPNPTAPAIR
jgi:tetratricopeptide (TPR) repeat protein